MFTRSAPSTLPLAGAHCAAWTTARPGEASAPDFHKDSQSNAATNDVYLYPGTSSPFDLTHLLPLVLVAIFFYLLIRLTWGRRRRSDRYFEQKLAHQREKQGQAEEKKVPDQQ